MEDIDKIQEQIEHIDALIYALLPFVQGQKHYILLHIRRTIEPLKHLNEMMQMFEMLQAMQELNS